MNPEFLREGRAVEDFLHPDRIVIGADDEKSAEIMKNVYAGLHAVTLSTGVTAAEMIKYAANSLLATKISFSNEIGNLCKVLGVDVYEVMKGVGLDHRISPFFLNAGAGFGGSCFPKDVSALAALAEKCGTNPILLKAVLAVNEQQPLRLISMLEKKLGNLSGKRICVLGLAFKDNTDDIRESRSIPVIEALKERGADIVCYDSMAADVIGFTTGDDIGQYGLEEYYDDVLSGSDGREYGYLNSDENLERTVKAAEDGRTLITSLDVNIQSIVEKNILAFNEAHKNEHREGNGSTNTGVIIMDPSNGEVLAMASYPVFDLNNPRNTDNLKFEVELDPADFGFIKAIGFNILFWNPCNFCNFINLF